MKKICPVMSIGTEANPNSVGFEECKENLCRWWVSAYTTEGIEVWDCAMVIGAKSDLEGKIPV